MKPEVRDYPKLVFGIIAVLLAVICLWRAAENIWRETVDHVECEGPLDYADLVAGMKGRDLGYVATDVRDLNPTDRERLIHMDWEVSPGKVTPVSSEEVLSWSCPIVGPWGSSLGSEDRYEANGFYTMAYNDSAVLRSRVVLNAEPREDHAPKDRSLSGLLGVLVTMGLFGFAWCRLRADGRPAKTGIILGLVVFVLLSSVSLRYGLTAPNGLAVYAGKAKLFLLAHGIPAGFFTDAGYADYQPAYPPGMVLPALISFLVGGCGNFWLQLFVPFTLSLLFIELASGSNPFSVVLALAYVLCPVAQRLAIGYYAEPLCALLLVLGYGNVCRGQRGMGWMIVGCSALIRPEGLLLACVLWLLVSMKDGRWNWRDVAAAVMPGVVWQLLMVATGSGLQGYDFLSIPDGGGVLRAAAEVVHRLVVGFDGSAIAVCAVIMLLGRRMSGRGAAATAFWASVVVLGVVLVGFSTSSHIEWIIEMSFGRYLWLSSAILVKETASNNQTI